MTNGGSEGLNGNFAVHPLVTATGPKSTFVGNENDGVLIRGELEQ